MNAWYNERSDTTAVPCCEKFIVTSKPICYVTKTILQNPRFTKQVHTKHNSPYGLQSTQVYGLQFELKSKAGRVIQEQAQQSTNAAVNIRQGIGHSSLKILEK